MKITVTQEHIDKAWANRKGVSCVNCPVALAIRDKGFRKVEVLNTGMLYVDQFVVPAPSEVISFIHYFDTCRFGRVETMYGSHPFSFDLDIPNSTGGAAC